MMANHNISGDSAPEYKATIVLSVSDPGHGSRRRLRAQTETHYLRAASMEAAMRMVAIRWPQALSVTLERV